MCYICRMRSEVASRELRNNTAGLIDRVQAGEELVITRRGKPVAAIVPVRLGARRWVPAAELARRLRDVQADAGLRADLERLAGETTDALPPEG